MVSNKRKQKKVVNWKIILIENTEANNLWTNQYDI